MKITNLLCIIMLLLVSQLALAQSPEQFKYQAAARNSSGQVLDNQNVSLRVSIRSAQATGTVEYQETHNATTNNFGLFSLNIGTGTATIGTFDAIDWGSEAHFMQVELDIAGGSNYTDMGTTQLLSVPYALYAKDVENKDDADADATNELQTVTKTGNTVTLSDNGGSFTDMVYDGDSSMMNELQTISKTGNTITLSNNGGSFTDAVNDADADATNEIQDLSLSGDTIKLSNSDSIVIISNNSPWTQGSNAIYYNTGKVGIGFTSTPSHLLQVGNGVDNNVIRLTGANSWGHGGRLNFGDADYVMIEEDRDDDITIRADRVRVETDSFKIGYHISHPMQDAKLNFLESFQAYNQFNGTRLYRGWQIQNTGLLTTYGPNGSTNTELSALSNQLNHGYIAVHDTSSSIEAGMFVDINGDGIIFGDQKNFRVPHPTKEGKEIWYGSLEGPELAAYMRGTADMVNGEVFVEFPEHYQLMANPTTMTVVLTPLSATSKGLAVVEKVANGFRIKELHSGTGNYQVDWEVKCVRKGKENYRVVRDASEMKSASELPVVETPQPKRIKHKNPNDKWNTNK